MGLIRPGVVRIVWLACALGVGAWPSPAHAFDRVVASPLDQTNAGLAINPTNGAEWLLGYEDKAVNDGATSCSFARSHDGGVTFAQSVLPRLGFTEARRPAVAFDDVGNGYLACVFSGPGGDAIHTYRFAPGADSPEPPVVVAAPVSQHTYDSLTIASAGARLHLAYLHREPTGLGPIATGLEVRSSSDRGVTWSAPISLGVVAFPSAAQLALAGAPDGTVYLASKWAIGHGASLGVSRSIDGGQTFDSSAGFGIVFFSGGRIAVAIAPNGDAYAIYPGADGGTWNGTTRVARSTDRGATWTTSPAVIAMPGLTTQAGAVTPDGRVHVAGVASPDGRGNLANVFRFTSADGGQTFGPAQRVSDFAIDLSLGQGSFVSLASDGSPTPRAAWTVPRVATGSDIVVSLAHPLPGQVPLRVSMLPTSRVTGPGRTAGFFVAVINDGVAAADGVVLASNSALPIGFGYWETDPATNQIVGPANPIVTIPPGGLKTFVGAVTPSATFPTSDVLIDVFGTNTAPLVTLVGVNTEQIGSFTALKPDIVGLVVTNPNTGILSVPALGSAAFAVAALNAGEAGEITVSTNTGGASLPVTIALCQTDPVTGHCISEILPTLTIPIEARGTPSFGVFATASGPIAFDPAVNRISVVFTDATHTIVGGTSVAVTTLP